MKILGLCAGSLVLCACLSVQMSEEAVDFRDEIVYFLLTDRFHNGDPTNDDGDARAGAFDEADTENPVGWHGGDFAGIMQKIEEGYFQELGFTALWISPPYYQAPGFRIRDTGSPNNGKGFGGFHGYWADDFSKRFDPHFGSETAYRKLIETAHAHGIKIVQDLVVNHLGSNASFYRAISDEEKLAWFNEPSEQGYGQDDIRVRLFGLLDFDQRNPEVAQHLDESVAAYVEAGVDAIRMDTIKHVEEDYWRRLFGRGGTADASTIWTVGEAYLHGHADQEILAAYMDMGFPSVFDFPLRAALQTSVAERNASLDLVARVIDRDSVYEDPTLLSTFLDNHDMARFVSRIDADEATRRERLAMGLKMLYYFRGIPIVYYGTEHAMPGKGDSYGYVLGKSSREDMIFDREAVFGTLLGDLAGLRQQKRTLRYGAQMSVLRPSQALGRDVAFFLRFLEGEAPILVVVNNEDEELSLPRRAFSFLKAETRLGNELLASAHGLSAEGGAIGGRIPPRSVLAFELDGAVIVRNVTLHLDAVTQGEGPVELLITDEHGELVFPMRRGAERGAWTLTLPLPGSNPVAYTYRNATTQEHEGLPKQRSLESEVSRTEDSYGFAAHNVPKFFLEGRVQNEAGDALAGTMIRDTRNHRYTAVSDAEGRYKLPLPTPASGTISAELPGYRSLNLQSSRGEELDFVMISASEDADFVLRDDPDEPLLWGSRNDLRNILFTIDERGMELVADYTVEDQNSLFVFFDTEPSGIIDASALSNLSQLAFFPQEHGVDYLLRRRGGEPLAAYRSQSRELEDISGTIESSAGPDSLQIFIPWSAFGIDHSEGGSMYVFAGIFGGEGYGGGDVAPDTDTEVVDQGNKYAVSFQEAFEITF